MADDTAGVIKNLLVNEISDVSAEGITLHFNAKVSLHGGVSAQKWWFSWDRIGQALFPERYCELSVASERRRLEKVTPPAALNRDDGWILVADRLPKNRESVLCYDGEWGRMVEESYEECTDQNAEWFKRTFTHWRPLPAPPVAISEGDNDE